MEERNDNNEKSVEFDENEVLTDTEVADAVEDMPTDLHTDNSVAEGKDEPVAQKPKEKKNRQHTASFSGTVCFINKCWRYTENIILRIKYPLAAYSADSEHFR